MTVPRRRPSRTAAALALAGLALAATGGALLGPWTRDQPASHGTGGGGAGVVEPTTGPVPSAPPVAGPGRGRPVRIEIPMIDVSARVVAIVTVADVLTPPDNVRVVGWWEDGAQPGDPRGTVLMTGHTFSRGDGVFDHLGEVAPGARVRVATVEGVLLYRVESVVEHPREQIVELAPRLFSGSSRPQLVLTTCSGYDGEHYRMTTVVRAVPVGAVGPADPPDVGSRG